MRWPCNPVSQVQVLEGACGRLTQLDRVPRLHRGSCRFKSCIVHFAPVAQLAERALGKCEVIRFDPDQELYQGEVYMVAHTVWVREVASSSLAALTLLLWRSWQRSGFVARRRRFKSDQELTGPRSGSDF